MKQSVRTEGSFQSSVISYKREESKKPNWGNLVTTGFKMGCSEWKRLQDDHEIATLKWGKYAESIKEIAKTNEHREILERLELETRSALSAVAQHEKEHGCNA